MEILTRTILALVLSVIVLLVYSYYFTPHSHMPKKKSLPEKQESLPDMAEKKIKRTLTPTLPTLDHKKTFVEKDVLVETPLFKAIFTTKNGSITGWYLKKHTDKKGNPVNLLNRRGPVPPFALLLEGKNADALIGLPYETNSDNIMLTGEQERASLTFLYNDGLRMIKKIYTFYSDRYKIDFTLETKGISAFLLPIGSGFGIFQGDKREHIGPVLLRSSDRIEFKAEELEKAEYFDSYSDRPIYWIAQEDKYFAAALAPVKVGKNVKVWGDGKDIEIAFELRDGREDFVFYAGPKEYDRLKTLGVGLEHLVNFGWSIIQPIARPIFSFLKFLYTYLHNYGLAIIFLTIIIRVPFIPLITKGQKTMKKMQALQPKMTELREKYKNDPQKMNRELMELYKKQKANPLGGCLPMLLQVPVFLALYNVLRVAVELRMAPFYFWIKDLSDKDPYYVLPIIMGLSMVVQQKMTPTSADPMQAKIMMFLPVIFTILFINFPSGLVLYWLINNLLAIIQQFYVNRKTA